MIGHLQSSWTMSTLRKKTRSVGLKKTKKSKARKRKKGWKRRFIPDLTEVVFTTCPSMMRYIFRSLQHCDSCVPGIYSSGKYVLLHWTYVRSCAVSSRCVGIGWVWCDVLETKAAGEGCVWSLRYGRQVPMPYHVKYHDYAPKQPGLFVYLCCSVCRCVSALLSLRMLSFFFFDVVLVICFSVMLYTISKQFFHQCLFFCITLCDVMWCDVDGCGCGCEYGCVLVNISMRRSWKWPCAPWGLSPVR